MRFDKCVFFLVGCLLASCNAQKELEKTRQALKDATDTLAKAVPGERYLRLIDAVNSGSPEEQKRAKEFVKSAFKVDLDVGYEVSATYTFDSSKRKEGLRTDIFVGATPDLVDVKTYISQSLRPASVSSSAPIPMTDAEIRTSISKLLSKNLLSGSKGSSAGELWISPYSESRSLPQYFFIGTAVPAGRWEDAKAKGDALVRDLANAVMMVRGERDLPLTQPHRTKSFNPLDGLDYVFVLINKDDFDNVTAGTTGNTFEVRVNAYESGHPDRPLSDSEPFRLHKGDFTLSQNPVVMHPTEGPFVWAERQITKYESITKATLQKIRDMRELSQKTSQENK